MRTVDLSSYDTDKPPGYLANYDRELGHLYDQPIAMLELGVQRGGSMLLWRDVFPKAQIAGLDLNPVDVHDDTGRIHIYTGFQQDTATLDRIAEEVAPGGFDLIIDDASHVGTYTAASFWHLFPQHLKAGGIYVLDDWSSGYWQHWPDGHAYTGSREALGDGRAVGRPDQPGRSEALRRRVRAAARPVANALETRSPQLRARLEDLYMKVEGATIRTRFPSHDYGMVGFVKQLIDACAVDIIDAPKGEGSVRVPQGQVASVHVTPSQVFVHKVT
jgi:hypothetical protein